MKKYCVFCGCPPTDKNKEHVLPRWLIALTGDPNRKARLGFRFDPSNPVLQREYAFDQFTFPACQACNSQYSDFEARAKTVVERVLGLDPLSPVEISLLLDWLDKVRVGLWLGFHMLNRDIFGVDPTFHIKHRIGQFDRVLVVQRSATSRQRLNFSGADTPAFSYFPSAFTLIINNVYLTNISSVFLLSRRLGFPYPDMLYMLPDRPELQGNIQPGLNRVIRPVLQRTFPHNACVVYQPMFGKQLGGYSDAHDSPYVRKHSLDFGLGIGSLFVEEPRKSIRPLLPTDQFALRPTITPDDEELLRRSAVDTYGLQNWLIDQPLSLEMLHPDQRRSVKDRQRLAKRFNNLVIKHQSIAQKNALI